MKTGAVALIVVGSMAAGGLVGWAFAHFEHKRRSNPEKLSKRVRREIRAEHREAERERLAKLRQALFDAKAFRALAMADFRDKCRGELAGARELRLLAKEKRASARSACRTGRAELGEETSTRVLDAKRELAEERQFQREMHRAERRGRAKVKLRRTKREAGAESDDEVRSNIPAELVPVFDRVRRSIKGSERRSRTETFLEWVEAHPEEVIAAEADAAELEAERMWREHESAA